MKINKNINITGYIEGYYGKILTWENRRKIITSLKSNNMNTYLYAPKEDPKNRLKWRDIYLKSWRTEFQNFTEYSRKNNVQVIAGIAPGLDFDYNSILLKLIKTKNDFDLLLHKAKQLLSDGASNIVLLLDDIPDNFKKKYGEIGSEGEIHALLANKLALKLKSHLYFVPRIYANELTNETPEYLLDLSKKISNNIIIFYCGKNVVSKNLHPKYIKKINQLMTNKIVYWDNYYANDYCPRRLFVGPWNGRNGIKDILINPTGMIQTDLLILNIVSNCMKFNISKTSYLEILKRNGVPKEFNNLLKFFNHPSFNNNLKTEKLYINKKTLASIEYLLWEWKSHLALEWYPYLFGLKHDLQLTLRTLSSDRIVKTQTIPLVNILLKRM